MRDATKVCHVLVVDDEEEIEEYVREVLRRRGYSSSSFRDPLKALDYFMENAEKVDLVVSDIVMPEMDGIQLAQRVAEIREDIPIILLSGYSDRLVEGAALPNVKALLDKPVLRTDLVQAVEGIIQSCRH
jgi:two-component system, cell cycle sensor histidine kinase and response regulator CckA